jgi:hypothetical protein
VSTFDKPNVLDLWACENICEIGMSWSMHGLISKWKGEKSHNIMTSSRQTTTFGKLTYFFNFTIKATPSNQPTLNSSTH